MAALEAFEAVAATRGLSEVEMDQNTRFTFVMQMTTQVRDSWEVVPDQPGTQAHRHKCSIIL